MTAAVRKPDVDVTVARVFDAPRDLVFKAWTDPKQLAQWWGPAGFTSPVCQLDARPGGKIHIEMHAPDGVVYQWAGTFREIDPPKRILFDSAVADSNGNLLFKGIHTVTFEENDGKTKLTVHSLANAVVPAGVEALKGMPEGWSDCLDRLAEVLAAAPRIPRRT